MSGKRSPVDENKAHKAAAFRVKRHLKDLKRFALHPLSGEEEISQEEMSKQSCTSETSMVNKMGSHSSGSSILGAESSLKLLVVEDGLASSRSSVSSVSSSQPPPLPDTSPPPQHQTKFFEISSAITCQGQFNHGLSFSLSHFSFSCLFTFLSHFVCLFCLLFSLSFFSLFPSFLHVL